MNFATVRKVLWVLVAIAAIGGAIIAVQRRPQDAPDGQAQFTIGAPFVLTDQNGERFDSRSLNGIPHVMFFGFTHCPDVCPTTLARLARLRKEVGKGDDSFAILFVTVDPERDTPVELAEYVKMFGTPVTALTGTVAEVSAVTRAFGIYKRKVPDGSGGYSMDHSSQVLLFDRSGRFGGTIALDEGDAPALQKLRNITSS